MSAAGPRAAAGLAVARFLGAGAAAGGPFALLGLTHERCEASDVTAALDRQTGRIDAHPQGGSAEADDVRLALHAAAAQLLNPAVRDQMKARWGGAGGETGDVSGGAGGYGVPTVAGADRGGVVNAGREAVASEGRGAATVLREAVATAGRAAGIPGVSVPGPVSVGGVVASASRFDAGLVREAQRVLAACGGWNGASRQRLMTLAAARGVAGTDVPELVRVAMGGGERTATVVGVGPGTGSGVGSGGMRGSSVGGEATARSSVLGSAGPVSFVTTSATGGVGGGGGAAGWLRDEEADAAEVQASRTMRVVLVATLAGIGLMGLAFWGVIVLTTPGGASGAGTASREAESLVGHTPEPERVEALFPSGAGGGVPRRGGADPAAAPARASLDASALTDELRVAIRGLSVDPAVARQSFRGLVSRAGVGWPDVPLDRRRSLVDAVVEFVYQSAGSSDGAVMALEDVAAGAGVLSGSGVMTADDVARASWSVGLLSRLQRERDISARAGSLIEARLGTALRGTRVGGAAGLDGGIAAALGVMPPRLVSVGGQATASREAIAQRVAAWERWLDCVRAVTTTDAAGRATLILGAMETLIHDAAQPTDDRQVFEAMGVLVVAMDWSEGGTARSWLVGQLSAPSVSSADVHAIMNAVATGAPAAGLDVSMVLSPRATDLERRELRERLALLWNLADAADQDELASAWREGLAGALDRHAADLTPVEHLASAIVLSRVSEAASLRWRGLDGEADDVLAALDGAVDGVLSAGAAGHGASMFSAGGDGRWAEQYLLAGRSIPIRQDLLRVFGQTIGQSLGPVDAEVLVEEAVRGSPAAVSRAAYDLVLRVSSNPNVVSALLEVLPAMPKTRRNSALVGQVTGESLPAVRDPSWEIAARRALVGRMLHLLAADSDLRVWDELAGLLAWSYLARAEVVSGAVNPGVLVDPPEVGAGLLRARWRRQAEALLPPVGLGLTVDEVDRRRAARLEIAKGPAQTFAAEQLAGLELMALVVAGEQPQRVEEVRQVLERLSGARQRAGHVAEQIAAGEAAGASLWAIRLKEGVP